MSKPSQPCQHNLLAQSAVGHAAICPECGVVHLALHGITIRFGVTAFTELTDMLTAAVKQLHSTQPPTQAESCQQPSSRLH